MIPLFDLHCDTLTKLHNNAPLHIQLDKKQRFSPYVQICAVWSDYHYSNIEAFANYCRIVELSKQKSFDFSTKLNCEKESTFILAVEDARILDNDITKLTRMFNDGVRVLTLTWKGDSCIGGGWDTALSLTEFGKQIVKKCAELGVSVDLSHASQEVQKEVIQTANSIGFSPIYSHSNSFAICQHKRNVTDSFAKEIVLLNGLIGVSLCINHLSNNSSSDINTVIKHIDHFLNIGCENVISLGCDFDGIDVLPIGINCIDDLEKLYYMISCKFGAEIAEKIFFYNAYNYFKNLFEGR